MPFVSIKMLEGRTKEQKKNLIESITKSVAESLNIDKEAVWVVVEDFPKDEWGLGGELASEKIKAKR
ncbi:MAG: 4-oxalocrotonate tautomerase family protein [Deltaproteobacteria bacterium]|jgi:4-oxalocrotonate tautomerase|nr:4-oxalocrotonate tautomerase family protein [Deltaproteobacteria bacterium]MCL5880613.1 4-oxalocrotonate tautomerase family protein [Deltaproteobacteria bacterium]